MGVTRKKAALWIHNNSIKSIFQILGNNEDDLSFSLGYALSFSPHLLRSFINHLYEKPIHFESPVIKLQQSSEGRGITDFEINLDNKYFIVIEAKKGWTIPDNEQLKRYLNRFSGYKQNTRRLVILTECSKEYATNVLPSSLYGTLVTPVSWQDVIHSINDIYHHAGNREKFVLSEFKEYLQGAITMENAESNWVYVVSLASGKPSWSEISWRDISGKKMRYFYPQGRGWPNVPPNYIAFRYDGRLQSIHHVERYEVVSDMHDYIPEIKKGKIKNHYLLYLGSPFEPRKELPNGNVWSNGRFWAMMDTLFTASSIEEAIKISTKRMKKMEL